jgi:hypothetical protein
MSSKPKTRHPDIQTITDISAGIYEAVATLEYSGTPATRGAITAATGLADDVIDQSLAAMLSEGLLSTALDRGEPVYVPTQRGWSTVPEQAEGKGLR